MPASWFLTVSIEFWAATKKDVVWGFPLSEKSHIAITAKYSYYKGT
jgi:hypothetical protein